MRRSRRRPLRRQTTRLRMPRADDTASDDMAMEEETVDLSGFVATEAMNRLSAEVDSAYAALCEQIKAVFPALTDDVLATLKSTITGIVAIQNDRFELQYDRALAASGMNPGERHDSA